MIHKKYAIILGTRPEIIKLYSLIKTFQNNREDFIIIHTNQHYSEDMDRIFFNELDIPSPAYNLHVGSGTHGRQTGLMLERIEKVLHKERPYCVFVQGDTNTVLAGSLVASKMQIKVAHVEAGLRSYDRQMPEEINRIMADHVSDFLFPPTVKQKKILLSENISKEKIHVVGNTIVDAVYLIKEIAQKKSTILNKLGLTRSNYILVTAHRQENVDYEDKLENIIKGLELVCKKFNMKVIYPIHPRAMKMLKSFKIRVNESIILIDPIGYLDMLNMLQNCRLLLTDSGGLQEESCILNIPCITLRENTERPETLSVKSNMLAGTDPKRILECAIAMDNNKKKWENPFGNGKTAEKIHSIISKA
ncbi:MAG: UDP-N-acetylglucosamine 2-epimerase [Spirochaetes bacterium RBG_16_49_21]|nr:MAG: UDP-N-acetylglucosamine 2-epimerase [Spirochaetes bacterium RBG_16_49_21]